MNSISTDTKEVRKFGLIAVLFFGCLSSLAISRYRPLPFYIFGSLSMMGLGFILFPSRLRRIYTLWIKLTQILRKASTTLILTLAYYLVITPSAQIKRLISGSPLPLKPDKDLTSYWIARGEDAQPKERFIKRY